MDRRILRYIIREIRRTINRSADRAIAIGSKVAIGTVTEGLGIIALFIGFSIGLSGCHTQKNITKNEPIIEEATQTEPEQWHTCLVQNAEGILTVGGKTISANSTIQAVRDSLVVLSIMPMLGIELLRIEATPTEVIGIDKMNRQYTQITYDEINRLVTPAVRWTDFQQLACGELPSETAGEAIIGYSALGYSLVLRIIYPAIRRDVPVRAAHIDLSRYQQKTFSELLQ